MFDTYRIESDPSHISATVTEKRAPTDESVRLLREMECAAFGEVLRRMPLESNEFKGQMIVHRNHSTYVETASCAFELNGQKMLVSVELSEDKYKTADRLLQAVAERIATVMLTPLFHKVLK